MGFVVIGIIIYAAVECVKGCRARARAREIERIKAEQKRARLAHNEEVKRQIQLEREQARQAKEQERLAREQARQAAQLARHEEMIVKLKQQVTLAEREIAHYNPILDELRQQAEDLSFKVEHFESLGLPCGGYKTQLEKVNNKLYRAETKVIKAEFVKQAAETKLTA